MIFCRGICFEFTLNYFCDILGVSDKDGEMQGNGN